MKLKHSLKPAVIADIEFVDETNGEAGWFIYLKPSFSFDPCMNDGTRFVPFDDQQQAMNLTTCKSTT
jgi:hypothetical protein